MLGLETGHAAEVQAVRGTLRGRQVPPGGAEVGKVEGMAFQHDDKQTAGSPEKRKGISDRECSTSKGPEV